ncbi:hypothetical protein QCA50_016160 [Cerrena zonata]|uniref:Uncharacterized protein n=1 Tax=Cerrena zonata TaxID=2478898 RepID=A0AAW0FH27_9APHY
MNGLVGDGQWFRRSVMLIAGFFWIAMFTYILLPDKFAHFSQASCVINSQISNYLYILPFVFVEVGYDVLPGAVLFAGIFVGLTIVGWFVGIWLQRKKIWSPDRGWTPRPGKVWAVTGREYPFIHLVSVVVIPNLYWIAVIETAVVLSGDGSSNLATYGQILSVFVAVPSLTSTLLLYPKLVYWFFDLTWVRRVPYLRMMGARWRESTRSEVVSSNNDSKHASNEDVNEYGLANISTSQVDLKENLVINVGR